MNQEREGRNVFFGMEVNAPWPIHLPRGRIVPEGSRHFTLAFLGPVDDVALREHVGYMPKPKVRVGLSGFFNEVLFFSNVVAYGAELFYKDQLIKRYQLELVEWLNMMGFPPLNQERGWINHITIARAPLDEKGWKRDFQRLPFIVKKMHLYKSVGNLTYEPVWSHEFIEPFEEIPHAGKVAFKIRGENFAMLKTNAEIALSFRFPNLFDYFEEYKGIERVEQLIQHLNKAIGKADSKEGSPLKLVRLNGEIEKKEELLEWEMVVEV